MRLLQNKSFHLFLIALGIIITVEQQIGRLGVFPDQLVQYVAAREFISGNGLTVPVLNDIDLASPNRYLQHKFPPGFSILVSPFLYFLDDIRLAHSVFSLFTILMFVILYYRLTTVLTSKSFAIASLPFIILFDAINGTFFLLGGSADLVCIILFLAGFLCLNNYIQNKKKGQLFLSAFFIVLTFYFRYAYAPFLIILPAFFVLRKITLKQPSWKEIRLSIIATITSSIPVTLHILYINNNSGYISNKVNSTNGFYWENLVQTSPFPFHSFYELYPLLKLIGYPSEFGYDRGYIYPNGLHFLFYLGSLIVVIPVAIFVYKSIQKKLSNSSTKLFYQFALLTSLALIMLIYSLSLTTPSQTSEYNWSWAKVFRYYLLPVFTIHTAYFLSFSLKGIQNFKKFLLLILGTSFIFSLTFKVYNYSKNFIPFNFNHNTSIIGENRLNSYKLNKMINAHISDNPKIVIFESSISEKFWSISVFPQINSIAPKIIESPKDITFNSSSPLAVYVVCDSKSNFSNQLTTQQGIVLETIGSFSNNIEVSYFELSANQ